MPESHLARSAVIRTQVMSGSERDEISKIKHPDQENLNTMQPIRNCTCKLATEAHVIVI